MKPLIEYCEGAVRALTAQYEMTKVIGHSVSAGSVREKLIFDFLTAHLPEMTTAVSGVIVDSHSRRSKQQDVVLMLKSMPRLPFASGNDLIFQEGALATIEIKTDISPSVLDKIGENIESVKSLQPSSKAGSQLGDLRWPWGRILAVVVTYGGSDLGIIQEKLGAMSLGCPDIYLDLTKGILVRNEGYLLEQTGSDAYLRFEGAGRGLAHFLALLSVVSGNFRLREIKWEKYMD